VEGAAGDDDQAGVCRALQRRYRRGWQWQEYNISPLYDAWTANGRTVYGAALANRQASDLAAAGIPAERRSSIAAFLWRAEHGRYDLNNKSVVVIDEVSLLSTRHQLDLLRLQKKHGFTLAEVRAGPAGCAPRAAAAAHASARAVTQNVKKSNGGAESTQS
jgi:hypothetical protein